MTSLGNSISAMKIPFSKLKIPKTGENAIIIKIKGFGPKYDKTLDYLLGRAKSEIKYFEIHPGRSGVITIQGATFAPIDIDVSGYTYFPTFNLE